MLWWLAYIALGLFTGLFAGMLGIGGGLLMVPTLTMMFAAQAGFPATEVLHLALGTSMAAILFTSLASLRAHHQHQAVLWKVVGQITPGILAGTLIGTLFAGSVPSRPLALFFMVFVCVVAVQMILDLKPKASRELPGAFGVFGVGTGIGALSALVAIGGGVPHGTLPDLVQRPRAACNRNVGGGRLPDRHRRFAGLHFQRLGAPRPATVERRLRVPAGAAVAGAIEHAHRTPRRPPGAPLAGGHPEASFRRHPDSPGSQDDVGSVRLMCGSQAPFTAKAAISGL